MLEKRKSAVDKRKPFRTFLTDLSKACDCLSRELLFAKVHGYGFSILVSPLEEILFGAPQGSILGSLLFNIFL